ncbi:MAG TPA: hypothetical protein VJY54_14860 [Lachnospiraceae bacterium]|nr:hypothetical protein [Lachnospiraceae bacterium]
MNDQISDSKNTLESGKKRISARKITIYADGQTKEEDLSNQFQS